MLDDALARFYPADGTEAVRVEGPFCFAASKQTVNEPVPTRLVAQDVEDALDGLRGQLGESFSSIQAGALRAWLIDPRNTPQIRAHWITDPARESHRSGNSKTFADDKVCPSTPRILAGGTLEFPPQIHLWILADGRIIERPFNLDPATGAPKAPPTPLVTKSLVATIASGVGALAALDVMLLVSGIMMLANSKLGARVHLLWAWLRFIALFVAVAPIASFASAMVLNGRSRAMIAPNAITLLTVYVALCGGIQLIYQFVVLALLRRESVRNYYHHRGGSVRLLPERWRAHGWRWLGVIYEGRHGIILARIIAAALLVTCGAYLFFADDTSDQSWWSSWTARIALTLAVVFGIVACFLLAHRKAVVAVALAAVMLVPAVATAQVPATKSTTRPTPNYDDLAAKLKMAVTSREDWKTAVVTATAAAEAGDITLYAMLSDKDPNVRQRALWALRQWDMKHPPAAVPWIRRARSQLLTLMHSETYSTAECAARLLLLMGESGLLDFIDIIGMGEPEYQYVALRAIRRADQALFTADIRKRLEHKIPAILDLLSDPRNQKTDYLLALAVFARLGDSPVVRQALHDRFNQYDRPERWMIYVTERVFPKGEERDDILFILTGRGDAKFIDAIEGMQFSLFSTKQIDLR